MGRGGGFHVQGGVDRMICTNTYLNIVDGNAGLGLVISVTSDLSQMST